jgi:GTPase SAR1 family protein
MYITFIIGTAGSGKSTLTSRYSNWLKMKNQDVITVNLDPGALNLPYTPDIDIRDNISIYDLMENYNLGPNGALIMAADLIAEQTTTLNEMIEDYKADYIIIDTPGQMELFAFRQSGPYIANELSGDSKAVLYLFDAAFSNDPLNYVSNMFLATAVYNRFLLPQVHILSKSDLVSKKDLKKILDWSARAKSLELALEEQLSEMRRVLSKDIAEAIRRLGLVFSLFSVSSKTDAGFINLHAALTRIFSGGEEITE